MEKRHWLAQHLLHCHPCVNNMQWSAQCSLPQHHLYCHYISASMLGNIVNVDMFGIRELLQMQAINTACTYATVELPQDLIAAREDARCCACVQLRIVPITRRTPSVACCGYSLCSCVDIQETNSRPDMECILHNEVTSYSATNSTCTVNTAMT